MGHQGDEERDRDDLRNFLDQCQNEFSYLLITPANPLPPRESPPLPMMEDLREGDFAVPLSQQPLDTAFQNLRLNQNPPRDPASRMPQNPAQNPPPLQQQPQQQQQHGKHNEPQSAPMVRSGENPSGMYSQSNEWQQAAGNPPISRAQEEQASKLTQANNFSRAESAESSTEKRSSESEGWDFNEASFPDPASSQPMQPSTQRPDTDVFPSAENLPKSPNRGPSSHRRKTSLSRRRSSEQEVSSMAQKVDNTNFKLRFGLRGHLNAVRTVIFSGGGSPGEPEVCTAGDDGLVKRFHLPRDNPSHLTTQSSDLDVPADFTHRGHAGAVLCLTSWSPAANFSTGGRAQGDGWIFSGGQDATIRVWERGRVDPKATMDGHTDAVWAICVLPATLGSIFGQTNQYGPADRVLLASGGADGVIKVWAVSAPPQPQPASAGRRAAGSGRVRGNSMSSGSQFPNSPQPSMASHSPFYHTLVHDIRRSNGSKASPTCITPLSTTGETFVVSFSDASIIVFDTKTGEEVGSMASFETYDNTIGTSVNAVVATTAGLEQSSTTGLGDEDTSGPTGGSGSSGSGVEGVIISGHEDRFIRFFDANSGQFTFTHFDCYVLICYRSMHV